MMFRVVANDPNVSQFRQNPAGICHATTLRLPSRCHVAHADWANK
jgi:hypothetical protein